MIQPQTEQEPQEQQESAPASGAEFYKPNLALASANNPQEIVVANQEIEKSQMAQAAEQEAQLKAFNSYTVNGLVPQKPQSNRLGDLVRYT